jgi:hypothetical protein
MLLWEAVNANANDTLFINKISGILEKYGMHTPMELLINPPSKHMGKPMTKKAILLPSMHRQLYMRFFQVSTEITYRRFAGVVQAF